MEEALEVFYSLQKLRILCEKANRNNIIQEYSQLLEEGENIWNNSHSEDVRVYFHIFKMIVQKDEEAFLFVEKFIDQNQAFLSSTYFTEVIEYLMNFCILNLNKGRQDFALSYLKFIELLEKENLLLIGGSLNNSRFTNCIIASIIGQRLDWMQAFSNKYSDRIESIDEESKQAIRHFNEAIIALHLGKFNQSFDLLSLFQASKVYLKDVYYKIASDKMMLKIYYNSEEPLAVQNRIKGVTKYIRTSEKLSEDRKKPHLTFLNILQQKIKEKPVAIESFKSSLLLLDYWWLKNCL